MCTEVGLTGSDGGLAHYTLVIEPFTALLRLRRNALVFQDLDVQGIVTRVLDDHPLSAFRWDVTQPLPVRPITTQYREDDFDFLERLLTEAGLAWHFEADEAAYGGHTWVIRDRDAPVPDRGPACFHRLDATESDDATGVFRDRLQATPTAPAISSWQTAATARRRPASSACPMPQSPPPASIRCGSNSRDSAARSPMPAASQIGYDPETMQNVSEAECSWILVERTTDKDSEDGLSDLLGEVNTIRTERIQAGQHCSQSGWWYTPAQSESRRYFKKGDMLLSVECDYGDTFCLWAPNQRQPKL